MTKNTTGGKGHKRKANKHHVTDDNPAKNTPRPDGDDQGICIVTKICGGKRFILKLQKYNHISTNRAKLYNVDLQGIKRQRVKKRLKLGEYVLVSYRDFSPKNEVDIIYQYKDSEVGYLKHKFGLCNPHNEQEDDLFDYSEVIPVQTKQKANIDEPYMNRDFLPTSSDDEVEEEEPKNKDIQVTSNDENANEEIDFDEI